MRAAAIGLIGLGLVLAACGRSGSAPKTPETGFHTAGVGSPADPTVKGARLLPESVDETQGYGSEPGGGVRAITAGLRVVTTSQGAILAAEDRLPQSPSLTTTLPDRLGGGFLFVLGNSIWRSDKWLGAAKPIYTSSQSIQAIVPGLDRVYIKAQNGYAAIDGSSGAALDLGPWPQSPYVASYAAADGWRAAAVTDLRGLVATFDAGATWRPIDLQMEAKQVLVSGDSLAIGCIENARGDNAWFEVRPDGSIARLGGPPREAKAKILPSPPRPAYYGGGYYPGGYPQPYYPQPAPSASAAPPKKEEPNEEAPSAGVRIFGKRPLAAAIEDGWPLTDGTAVIARDGALGRVRLSDGALTELVQGAYPLKPSRCHPVSLTRPNAVGAFGFVCGEPRGTTVVYAYDPMRGKVEEIKRFDRPRVVTSSGNGGLVVRGPCAEDADVTPPASTLPKPEALKPEKKDDKAKKTDDKDKDDAKKEDDDTKKDDKKESASTPAGPPEVHPFCILGFDNVWREVHVRGDVGGERVVVLSDGKIAVVSPPQTQTAPARLTILEKGKATTLPIVFPKVPADVARVLRLGVWLDGFEERKPGVIGGWLEAGGTFLGLEIALDGKATPGQYIRDLGNPFVSGKYGIGLTQSHRGHETTDGGMTWKPIVDAPDQLAPASKAERRACGPIGCLANGWLRVGWGEGKKATTPPVPSPSYRSSPSLAIPNLALTCEPLAPTQPTPAQPKAKTPAPTTTPTVSRRPTYGSPVLSPLGGFQGSQDLPGFFAQPGTLLKDPDRGLNFEVHDLPERVNVGSLARVYGWGPRTGEWDTAGKWQVKWLSPFAGWNDVKATVPVPPPQVILDYTKQSYAYGGYYGSSYGSSNWTITPGDEPNHALLVARRVMRGTELSLFELEAERAPVEIRRLDGEPFTEIEAAVRASGRWFLVTPPPPSVTAPVTVIWQVDGAVARELVRVPRATDGTQRTNGTHLARRSDGRAIGLVVDGQYGDRSSPQRWVLPIDLESAQLGDPESVGYADMAGRTLEACTDDVVGWIFDSSVQGMSSVRLRLPGGNGSIHSLFARLRVTPTRACVDRISGTYDGQSPERAAQLASHGAAHAATMRPGDVLATAFAAQSRYALRCTVTK